MLIFHRVCTVCPSLCEFHKFILSSFLAFTQSHCRDENMLCCVWAVVCDLWGHDLLAICHCSLWTYCAIDGGELRAVHVLWMACLFSLAAARLVTWVYVIVVCTYLLSCGFDFVWFSSLQWAFKTLMAWIFAMSALFVWTHNSSHSFFFWGGGSKITLSQHL